jgi:adenylylsulfate kinase|tara:strand:- start:296 stop:634 length:339 start_codon:yes stop_codon:yes gene_type:complete
MLSDLTIYNGLLTNQKINLIFNLIGMYNRARRWNRKNIDNYVEIYIKADIHKIIKLKRKAIYLKNKKNIVGLDIKAEFPKKPHITINNDFTRSTEVLSKELLNKIKSLNIKN